jgi:putative nucleotidyltransferase with HDIG domain
MYNHLFGPVPSRRLGITPDEVKKIKTWFTAYVRSFCHGEWQQQRNYRLKEEHSLRVCEEIVSIGRQTGWQADELVLAETIALLHDIGRFEQFARYHTFVDRRSENHAELGLEILANHALLDGLTGETREVITEAIRHHNRAHLPSDQDSEWLIYARLLRDADKIDIWRIVTEYYDSPVDERNEAIELDLPDSPDFSEQVLQDLTRHTIVKVEHLHTLNDFKLLQMGWIYDINYLPTCRVIRERCYLERIRRVLPASERIDEITHSMQHYLTERIAAG